MLGWQVAQDHGAFAAAAKAGRLKADATALVDWYSELLTQCGFWRRLPAAFSGLDAAVLAAEMRAPDTEDMRHRMAREVTDPDVDRCATAVMALIGGGADDDRRSEHMAGGRPCGRLRRQEALVGAAGMSRVTADPQCFGFIGLGRLGRHLASNLRRGGFDVVVHDLDRDAAADPIAAGATWVASPRDVGEAADSVITCLPSPAAVTAVVAGADGVLGALRPGGTWIDMSTNDADELKRLADLAASSGIACLEAPVTGGVHRAATGEITVLVGGDHEVYQAHLPAFRAMGGEILHMGPLGSATVIKVITNMLAFVHLVAAGEALMLAKRGGLDLAQAFAAIRASSGNSFVHETESQVILNGSYDIGFTMDLALKDLGFARQLGTDFGVPLELATLVERIFARAHEQYGGDAWSPMVVRLLEEALGAELRAAGFPATLEPTDGEIT